MAGAILLVTVVVLALLLASIYPAHVAVSTLPRVDVTVADSSVADDGAAVVVRVRLDNPTPEPLVVSSRSAYGGIILTSGEQVLNIVSSTRVSGTTVAAGDADVVILHLPIREKYRDLVAGERASLVVSGTIEASVAGKEVDLDLESMEVDG